MSSTLRLCLSSLACVLVTGCGASESCEVPAQTVAPGATAAGFCFELLSATPTALKATCDDPRFGGTLRPHGCAAASRVGRCEVKVTEGLLTLHWYAPVTAAVAREACGRLSGGRFLEN